MNGYLLNLSMKYYNQIDIMPVFQAIIVYFIICAGLVLLDESAYYTWEQLFRIFMSSIIIASGIYVITLKQSSILQYNEDEAQEVDGTESTANSDYLSESLIHSSNDEDKSNIILKQTNLVKEIFEE